MRTITRVLPVVLIVSTLGVACSSDDETSSFCESRQQLQSSILDISNVDVRDNGIDALDAQLTTISDDLDAVREAAGELQPEVDAVRTDVEALLATVQSATSPAEGVVAITSGLSTLSASWEALQTAADANCD